MTTTDTDRRRKPWEPNPDGSLPCVSCGRRVKHPNPAQATPARRFWAKGFYDVPATRCDSCTRRRLFAMTLLAQHPRIRRAHGDVALDRLDAALTALDFAGLFGLSRRMLNQLTESDQRIADLIRFMAEGGAAASWVLYASSEPSHKPWAHVPAEIKKEINEDLRRLVRRPIEGVLPFAPPNSESGASLPGCLFCGIGTVTARESDAATIWGSEHRAEPSVLGGRPRPEPATGYLCPVCRPSFERTGAMGMPAVEHALMTYLGYRPSLGWTITINLPFYAFAALRPGTEPNGVPWSHLDTAAIRDALASTVGVQPIETDRR